AAWPVLFRMLLDADGAAVRGRRHGPDVHGGHCCRNPGRKDPTARHLGESSHRHRADRWRCCHVGCPPVMRARSSKAKSMLRRSLVFPLLAVAAATAWAQDPSSNPYAGQQSRSIKALSEDDIAALLKGAGIGLAKAAELNGYPGPAHVLAL